VTSHARRLLDLVFPPRCLSCKRLGSFLCDTCRTGITAPPPPFCPTCHQPVDPRAPYCRCSAPPLRHVVAAGEFAGPLREAIHRFKYAGQSAGASALATLLISRLAGILAPDQLVVPMPLHPQRQRQRGYNQAALLGRAIAPTYNCEVAENALRRTRHTTPQVNLNLAERARNMDGAFAGEPDLCRGRHIILVDDVCTTGATLRAAASAARNAGARSVYAAVLAVTPLGGHAR
jgi:ComF family protein